MIVVQYTVCVRLPIQSTASLGYSCFKEQLATDLTLKTEPQCELDQSFPFSVGIAITLGCDRAPEAKKSTAADRTKANEAKAFSEHRAAMERDLIGTWEMVVGKKEPGAFYAVMTMDLKPDKTLSWSNDMPDLSDPAKSIVNKATGRWEINSDGTELTVHLEALDPSRRIPDDEKQIVLEIGSGGGAGKAVDTILVRKLETGEVFRRKVK